MTDQIPTIGRIVHYRLSVNDTVQINRRREHAYTHDDDRPSMGRASFAREWSSHARRQRRALGDLGRHRRWADVVVVAGTGVRKPCGHSQRYQCDCPPEPTAALDALRLFRHLIEHDDVVPLAAADVDREKR